VIRITPEIVLREGEIREAFVRSPGPGGQKVNKASTAVELRFDVRNSPSLPEEVRERLLRLAGGRLSGTGVLIIQASRFRTQSRNRRDAFERLAALIHKAAQPPRPRVRTRAPASVNERRLGDKGRRGETKRRRRRVGSPGNDAP